MTGLAHTHLRLSLAERRYRFWDAESRARCLDDWESRELERALRDMDRNEIRAQAPPPPPRKRVRR